LSSVKHRAMRTYEGSGGAGPPFMAPTQDIAGSASCSCCFNPWEIVRCTRWIGGWVSPRAGVNDTETWKFLTASGLELRPLGRPARSQSLHRPRYIACTCYKRDQIWEQQRRNAEFNRDIVQTGTGSLPRRLWFNPRLLLVPFDADEEALQEILLRVSSGFSPFNCHSTTDISPARDVCHDADYAAHYHIISAASTLSHSQCSNLGNYLWPPPRT
jgi:hypothetical protein